MLESTQPAPLLVLARYRAQKPVTTTSATGNTLLAQRNPLPGNSYFWRTAASSLKRAQALLGKYRLQAWVKVQLSGRKVVWTEDSAARQKQAELDGCYVIESDLPKEAGNTQQVHDRYLDLTQVERDFRTLKTGLLELRPIFLRKEGRTRGHAVVCLLALKLARELDRRLAPLGLTVQDGLERLKGVRLVRLGESQPQLWRLPTSYPPAQTEVLEALPRLKPPMLSLRKANRRRLTNPRKGRG